MDSSKSSPAPEQLLCVECAALHRPAEFCPVHPDEPLLDPTDDDVILELIRLDDRARGRAFTFWGVSMGAIGLLIPKLRFRRKFARWTAARDGGAS